MPACSQPFRATALALTLVAVGCASPLPMNYFSGSRKVESQLAAQAKAEVGDADAVAGDADKLRTTALRKANGEASATEEEALAEVLDELAEIRAIDPSAEAEVRADLKAAKPEYYPLIVQQFRAALAYRQQLAERAKNEAAEFASHQPGDPAMTASSVSDQDARWIGNTRRAERLADANANKSVGGDLAVGVTPAMSPTAAAEALLAAAASVDAARQNPGYAAGTSDDRYATGSQIAAPLSPGDNVQLLPPPVAPEPDEVAVVSDHVAAVRTETASKTTVTPVSYAAPPSPPCNWHAELAATIADLERAVRSEPTTVEEVHDHLRLRALMLLAGRDEDAYRPIPGASPAQQDYWSKQLFAIDAYLDGAAGRDDKQRAAAALIYLDQARAQLSELATLQLRNLSFVESVSGFGAYKPAKEARFRPGQHVTIYAEVENFKSRVDAEGHHTILGTSYQVLDKAGQRVDGAQFSDVVDLCKNRRRDFHMQYDLPLPTRIYPGTYQLELTITDHTSNKIGVAKLKFEIVGDGRRL